MLQTKHPLSVHNFVGILGWQQHIPSTLVLSYTNFVLHKDSEKDVGSLVVDEIDNDNDFMSFIVKVWGLERYSKPFTMPKDEEMFQSKLFDILKFCGID